MFSNFLFVAMVIIALWLGVLVYYVAVSSQQEGLQDSLEALRGALDGADGQDS